MSKDKELYPYKDSLFHRDAIVFMIRDGKSICPICGEDLINNRCPECEGIVEIIHEEANDA